MKKYFKLFILLIIFVGCTGCNGNITRDIRHAGFTLSNSEFVCSYLMPKDDEDTSYLKIKYLGSSYAITEDNKIYDISLGQKFSNDENCKKADTDIEVVATFDNKIAKAKDGKYYYLVSDNNVKAYTEVNTTNKEYSLYKIFFSDATNIKIITADSNSGSYYTLKDDGNIYNYIVTKPNNNANYSIVKSSVVYNKNNYDGKIIDFNYSGESLNTFIKTEGRVHRMMITNSDECNKYADISCKYEIKDDEIFTTYKDKILAYNGTNLITTYGKMFTVGSKA